MAKHSQCNHELQTDRFANRVLVCIDRGIREIEWSLRCLSLLMLIVEVRASAIDKGTRGNRSAWWTRPVERWDRQVPAIQSKPVAQFQSG